MKVNLTITTVLAILTVLFSASASANSDGKALHDEKCMGCHMVKHDASFYGREGSKATDKASLRTWVSNCQLNFGLQWWDEDIDAVTEFLNTTYYKFK